MIFIGMTGYQHNNRSAKESILGNNTLDDCIYSGFPANELEMQGLYVVLLNIFHGDDASQVQFETAFTKRRTQRKRLINFVSETFHTKEDCMFNY